MHPDQFARRDRVEVEAPRPLVQVNQLILTDPDAREMSRQLLHRVALSDGATRELEAPKDGETEDEP
jgi:hypothetical protein